MSAGARAGFCGIGLGIVVELLPTAECSPVTSSVGSIGMPFCWAHAMFCEISDSIVACDAVLRFGWE